MAQQNGEDLSLNVSAATQALLAKLDDDLPTIVRCRATRCYCVPAPAPAPAPACVKAAVAASGQCTLSERPALMLGHMHQGLRSCARPPLQRQRRPFAPPLRTPPPQRQRRPFRAATPPHQPNPCRRPSCPQVPEELVAYHSKQAGCNCDDDPQL
jgi:hypothetical protein